MPATDHQRSTSCRCFDQALTEHVHHELPRVFAEAGLALCNTLTEMLDEHFAHQTVRRGCGFAQATRYLSRLINRPRDPMRADDLQVFADWPLEDTESLAELLVPAHPGGWRCLLAPGGAHIDLPDHAVCTRLRTLASFFSVAAAQLEREESRIFLQMLNQVLSGVPHPAPELPGMTQKPEIGSCSEAESFFLEIIHGRIRRGGSVNVIVDDAGHPLLVEKIGLGESHSAMSVGTFNLFGVNIPPGSLCALSHAPNPVPLRQLRRGLLLPINALAQVRFMRLTTLAISPPARARAFGRQLEAQVQASLFSPLTTTFDQLRELAERWMRE
jgi:hypothetical protein